MPEIKIPSVEDIANLRPYHWYLVAGFILVILGGGSIIHLSAFGVDLSHITPLAAVVMTLLGLFLLSMGTWLAKGYSIATQAHKEHIADIESGKRIIEDIDLCGDCEMKIMKRIIG